MKHLLFLSIMICQVNVFAQRDFSEVDIKATQVSKGIFMLEGSGGNIGLSVGEDGVVMIDNQFAGLSDKIKNAIAELSDHPVKYVLNTHWHGDHTGGNENFGNDGAIIIAHENVYKRLSTDQFNKAFNRTTKAAAKEAWPQITFEKDMSVRMNGEEVMLLHVHNAHTDGDAFVYFSESNVLHMGDCFFNERFPYIDLGSGGSIDGAIEAVEMALMIANNKTQIIPGHGFLASKMDLLKYFTMLKTMRSRVLDAMASGKSLDDMKAGGLDEGYEDWGDGFISTERFIDIIWTDFNREKE